MSTSATIYAVVVNNGDTEPELWAFVSEAKAEAFAEVRMGASLDAIAKPQAITVLNDRDADEAIEQERSANADFQEGLDR